MYMYESKHSRAESKGYRLNNALEEYLIHVHNTEFPEILKNHFPYFFYTNHYFFSFFEICNHETQFCTLHNTA